MRRTDAIRLLLIVLFAFKLATAQSTNVSYEGLRLRQPQSSVIEVPSLVLRNATTTTQAARAVLDAYPVPNGPTGADGDAAQFTGSYSTQVTMDASATYLGQVGRRLLRTENEPDPNSNFSGGFTLMKNGDTSNYNALQLQYKMTTLHGMQALANYIWSHSIDTNSSDAAEAISTVFFPVAGERGSSDFDVRHNFTSCVCFWVIRWSRP